jgi:hypothetical protein
LYERLGYALEVDASAAARAWAENPTIRRMLGPPRVLKLVKDISDTSAGETEARAAA